MYVTSIFMCFFSGVYLYFRILMYVKRHEQFEIGCGAVLNKIYYYIIIKKLMFFIKTKCIFYVVNCKLCVSDEWEEEEMEEDNDSDGSWVDVSHSEGEAVSFTDPA